APEGDAILCRAEVDAAAIAREIAGGVAGEEPHVVSFGRTQTEVRLQGGARGVETDRRTHSFIKHLKAARRNNGPGRHAEFERSFLLIRNPPVTDVHWTGRDVL